MKAKHLIPNEALVSNIFSKRWKHGSTTVSFTRAELEKTAFELGVIPPKNLGDVFHMFSDSNPFPAEILDTQPRGMEWSIEGAGQDLYEFRLIPIIHIAPSRNRITIKIPDATPEITPIGELSDEQALLALIRYNRLVDIFLGIAAYSLQSHFRTNVKSIGRVEIDEVYVGVDRLGCKYIVPVQVRGGSNQPSTARAKQDIACCAGKFPNLVCRAISAQFMDESKIALFELCLETDGMVRVVEEKHYRLVPSAETAAEELASYRQAARR